MPQLFQGNSILEGMTTLSLSLSVKNENYKEDNNKNSKMSGQAEASPLLKAALGFVVKMCCLLQKHASPPPQNKWAVPDIFTSNCSSVCGESCSLSRQLRPVHLRDRRRAYPETNGRKQLWAGSREEEKHERKSGNKIISIKKWLNRRSWCSLCNWLSTNIQ